MMLAIYYDQVVIVDYVIHTLSDIGEYLSAVDLNGNTPFHKANQSGSSKVIKYIFQAILTNSTPKKENFDIVHFSLCSDDSRNERILLNILDLANNVGDSPLAVACRHGHLNIIKIYIYYLHYLTTIDELLDILSNLLNTASTCGQFEIENHIQRNYDPIFLKYHSENEAPYYYEPPVTEDYSAHDLKLEVKVSRDYPKLWNIITFQSQTLCMAILHNNMAYVDKHIALLAARKLKVHNSYLDDACIAASVSDNVDVLKKLFISYGHDNTKKIVNRLLSITCEWGSKNVAEYLLANAKCDLSATNNNEETPLHVACRHRNTDIVNLLLNNCPCDILDILDKQNASGETPLHLVCLRCTTATANLILDITKVPVDSQDVYGDTPLMNACYIGSLNLIKRLVDIGYNPLYVNKVSEDMPVHVACRMQRLDILQIIVKNVTTKIDHRNVFGESPLCVALSNSSLDIVQFLLQKGLCDISLPLCTLDHSPLNDASAADRFPVNCDGGNALHFACEINDLELLQLLLKHSSSPDLTVANNFGNTPFHISAEKNSIELLKLLITKFNAPLDSLLNHNGDSVLHLACKGGSVDIVQLLIQTCSVTLKTNPCNTPISSDCSNKSGALFDCSSVMSSGNLDHLKNKNSDTVLHVAARVGDPHTINFLLNYCSTTCQNSDGDTPIHIACRSKNQPVIKYLLKKQLKHSDSSVSIVNNLGQTYLHAACLVEAQLVIVKTFFNNGYSMLGNYPDKDGDIPLHYACRNGQIKVVEYLMSDKRCNSYRFNNSGLSPLYYALLHRHFELIKVVVKKRLCDINQPIKDGLHLLHCLIRIQEPFEIFFNSSDNDELSFPSAVDALDSFNCSSDILHIVEMLTKLDNEAVTVGLNAIDSRGNAALHLACLMGKYDIVEVLISQDVILESLSHRNHDDKTPIQLTSNYDIIRLLISYGADPEDVSKQFASILERSKAEQPLESSVKIVVIGNSTAGKTTLIEALKSGKKDIMYVKSLTAGIEKSEHNSKIFGRVHFHDFAGQPEYESTHSFFLEQCSPSTQPALFLLVIDASQNHHVEKQVHRWLSFIQNHCTTSSNTPPHVVVIGSHIDKVEDVNLANTNDTFVKAIDSFKSSAFECFEPVFLDCRKVDTKGMKILLSRLESSCSRLKQFAELNCRCHILFAHLLKWFPTSSNNIRVKDLLCRIKQRKNESINNCPRKAKKIIDPSTQRCRNNPRKVKTKSYSSMQRDQNKAKKIIDPSMQREISVAGYGTCTGEYTDSESFDSESAFLLPITTEPLIQLLKSLHTGGHILLLQGDTFEDSWIVMNQDALFKSVNGILFAPKEFQYHNIELGDDTGVVPLSQLKKIFPSDLDFGMIKHFLIHYEFCHEIEDNETLKLIHGGKDLNKEDKNISDTYYFFPGFIQSEKPVGVWDIPKDSSYSLSHGWMLQCKSKQFLETRFLHVLLLRLTFTFVSCTSTESSVFKRQCNIWKNGIHWSTRKGVEVLVELIEDKTLVRVLVRCLEGQELEAIKLRTAVVKKIWEAKKKFCPKISTNEYVIHPNSLANTCLLDRKLYPCTNVISIKEIAKTVIEGSPCVICPPKNQPLSLDRLLYYEPYKGMDEEHVRLLFSNENKNKNISSETFYSLSNRLCPAVYHLIKVLKIPETELGFHREQWRDHPVQLLYHLFESWACRREKPTFQTLRSEFDEYSIFFGRDPQEICKSIPDPKEICKSVSKPDPMDTDEDNTELPSDI